MRSPNLHRNCVASKPSPQELPKYTVGTELKGLLAKIGIRPAGNCQCNQRASIMDVRGPDWCEKNIELIVDWLEEEAHKRKMPFVRLVSRTLVKLAIHRARKKVTK